MGGWHHQLEGRKFEQVQGVDDGQGSLACCSPWGGKKLDTAELLDNNNNNPKEESVHFSSELKNTGIWNIFCQRIMVN